MEARRTDGRSLHICQACKGKCSDGNATDCEACRECQAWWDDWNQDPTHLIRFKSGKTILGVHPRTMIKDVNPN